MGALTHLCLLASASISRYKFDGKVKIPTRNLNTTVTTSQTARVYRFSPIFGICPTCPNKIIETNPTSNDIINSITRPLSSDNGMACLSDFHITITNQKYTGVFLNHALNFSKFLFSIFSFYFEKQNPIAQITPPVYNDILIPHYGDSLMKWFKRNWKKILISKVNNSSERCLARRNYSILTSESLDRPNSQTLPYRVLLAWLRKCDWLHCRLRLANHPAPNNFS